MSLPIDQISTVSTLQTLVESLVRILNEQDGTGEVTVDNITALNNTLGNALIAIDNTINAAP